MACTIVVFGASGDLTSRRLVPALYELHRKGRLPDGARVVGFARTGFSDDAWRKQLAESTARFVPESFDAAVWQSLATSISYCAGDLTQAEDIDRLRACLDRLEGGAAATRVYYLATVPDLYEPAIARLGAAGMADQTRGPRRIVIEKPFGSDLPTAEQLNQAVHQVFLESQVYRIDHYLGKETVQNVLVLRLANAIFEPVWNRNYVDHVQITAAEALKVGHRAEYYDRVGVLRDMFQNHLLQLLTLTAMEAPARFEADAVRDEKVKVLRAIKPLTAREVAADTLRGQYERYRDEPGVAFDSRTATFAAAKLHVDNWRWQGVPFYLRSGKAMSCRTTQIVIQFRQVPHMVFQGGPQAASQANRLVIQIQPAEGIQLHFHTKAPEAGMSLRMSELEFTFRDRFAVSMPDAYQRLLLDVMYGDASLFARADEVEQAWQIVDPIQAAWESTNLPPIEPYEAGGWGPASSAEWMRRQGREWFDSCPVLK